MSEANNKKTGALILSRHSPYAPCDAATLILRDCDGELGCKPVIALCRCGRSSNKPFCDGTHFREEAGKTGSGG